MNDATRFTNLEIMGDLTINGKTINSDMEEADYKATEPDATAAASTAPTKAEFDAVVDLVNELKTKHNALVKRIVTGT